MPYLKPASACLATTGPALVGVKNLTETSRGPRYREGMTRPRIGLNVGPLHFSGGLWGVALTVLLLVFAAIMLANLRTTLFTLAALAAGLFLLYAGLKWWVQWQARRGRL